MGKNKNMISYLLDGDLLIKNLLYKNVFFMIYLFGLIIVYIFINFYVENSLMSERENSRVMKNLKADYTAKSAKLLYKSKREEIEKLLKNNNSILYKEKEAPTVVILERE